MWSVEPIPDNSWVYVRVFKFHCKRGQLQKSAFENTPRDGDNLSCDWDRYSTPESSRALIGRQKNREGLYKNPLDFFIWKFSVQKLREFELHQQTVKHEPIYNDPEQDGIPNNQAHSAIYGQKRDENKDNDAKFRVRLARAGEWAIPPSDNT